MVLLGTILIISSFFAVLAADSGVSCHSIPSDMIVVSPCLENDIVSSVLTLLSSLIILTLSVPPTNLVGCNFAFSSLMNGFCGAGFVATFGCSFFSSLLPLIVNLDCGLEVSTLVVSSFFSVCFSSLEPRLIFNPSPDLASCLSVLAPKPPEVRLFPDLSG